GEVGELAHGAAPARVERRERAPFGHAQPRLAQLLREPAVAAFDRLREPEEDVALKLEGRCGRGPHPGRPYAELIAFATVCAGTSWVQRTTHPVQAHISRRLPGTRRSQTPR